MKSVWHAKVTFNPRIEISLSEIKIPLVRKETSPFLVYLDISIILPVLREISVQSFKSGTLSLLRGYGSTRHRASMTQGSVLVSVIAGTF